MRAAKAPPVDPVRAASACRAGGQHLDAIVQNGGANTRNRLRTVPLWGLRTRGRFMHDNLGMSVEAAIPRHGGQATSVRQSFEALSRTNKSRLLAFPDSLLVRLAWASTQGSWTAGRFGGSPAVLSLIFSQAGMSELVQKFWAKAQLWSGRNAIIGAIEHPTDDHPYAAWIDVRGWALGLDAESPLTIEFLVNDRVVHRVAPTLPRPDVGARLQGVPGSDRCGFETRLTTAVLPWQGVSSLTIRASSESPHRGQAVLGTRRIRRQDTIAARGNYGQVWDDTDVSGSITNARISVAGTSDPGEYDRTGEATAGDIAEHARVTPQDTVLEIGCGTGRIGIKLAPRCGHWIGADVSQNMLRHARETLRALPNVSFVHLNGTDLAGIADNSVDVAYCSGVFMHLDEWDRYRYIVEARRVLKPRGRVYFDNFNLKSDEGWALFEDLYRLEPAARPPNISRSSTPGELETYAERAAFTDIRVLARGLWVTVVGTKPVTG